jgi:iron complex outermembrane receptor protein
LARADDTILEEITVTAQKRQESSQYVPVTMQVFSADKLTTLGAVKADDLVKFTPGLNLAGANAGQTMLFGIRGVVQVDFGGQAESPVATYLDDGYIAGNSVTNIGLFDLDHIEVLKGPQGTLFGRNATGGVVSIASKLPTDTYEGYATAGTGSYGDNRLEGAYGGPITDTIKFRIAGVYSKNGAWIDNTYPGGDPLGANHGGAARAHLEFKPSDGLDVLLTGYVSEEHMSWGPYFSLSSRQVLNSAGDAVNSYVTSASTTMFNTLPSNGRNLSLGAVGVSDHGGVERMEGAIAKVTYDFGPQLTSITQVNQSSDREFISDNAASVPWLFSNNNNFARTLSQEVRLNGQDGGLRWLTGAYYLHISSGSNPDSNQYLPANITVNDSSNLYTDSYSIFGQVDYAITHDLTLTGGLRGTLEHKEFHYASAVYDLAGTTYLQPARSPYQGAEHEGFYTSKLALEYRPTDWLILYAQDSRGVKAGSFNAPTLGGTAYPDSEIPYKPEVLYEYELGEKVTALNDRLRINGSVFYYDYHDFQAFKIIGITTQVVNLPSTVYGAELEVTAKPMGGLTLQATASYTHDRVYNVSLGLPETVTRIAPYTSAWKAGALARYNFPGVFGGTLGIQLDTQYTGSYFYSLTNFDTTKIDDYTLLNARLNWVSQSGLWEGRLSGENLTDKRYNDIGFDFSGLCGCSLTSYGKPIWLNASITRKF